jgi:hypothetical protein
LICLPQVQLQLRNTQLAYCGLRKAEPEYQVQQCSP